MKNWIDYIFPAVFILAGLTIVVSPIGKVPRIPYAFGEYKYVAGSILIVVGAILISNIKKKHGK